jgi:hypothetical protein
MSDVEEDLQWQDEPYCRLGKSEEPPFLESYGE